MINDALELLRTLKINPSDELWGLLGATKQKLIHIIEDKDTTEDQAEKTAIIYACLTDFHIRYIIAMSEYQVLRKLDMVERNRERRNEKNCRR